MSSQTHLLVRERTHGSKPVIRAGSQIEAGNGSDRDLDSLGRGLANTPMRRASEYGMRLAWAGVTPTPGLGLGRAISPGFQGPILDGDAETT